MAKPTIPSTLLCLLFISFTASATIHDLLVSHGLPAGLLPKGVRSFSLNEATGLLEVSFDAPCLARYENMVHFDRIVKGNLSSRGEFKGVEGLSQEELFLWFPIKKFVVGEPYEGMVLIDIGMAQKQVSVSLFEEPPECRPIEGGVDRENGVVDVLADVKGTVELNAGRMEKGFEAQR